MTTDTFSDSYTRLYLDALIDDIDGSLDSLVGDSRFTDAQVREALAGIVRRCRLTIDDIDRTGR